MTFVSREIIPAHSADQLQAAAHNNANQRAINNHHQNNHRLLLHICHNPGRKKDITFHPVNLLLI